MNNHTCVSELEYEQYLKYCAFYGLGVQLPPQVPYNLIRRVRHPRPSPPLCVENYDYVM